MVLMLLALMLSFETPEATSPNMASVVSGVEVSLSFLFQGDNPGVLSEGISRALSSPALSSPPEQVDYCPPPASILA